MVCTGDNAGVLIRWSRGAEGAWAEQARAQAHSSYVFALVALMGGGGGREFVSGSEDGSIKVRVHKEPPPTPSSSLHVCGFLQ